MTNLEADLADGNPIDLKPNVVVAGVVEPGVEQIEHQHQRGRIAGSSVRLTLGPGVAADLAWQQRAAIGVHQLHFELDVDVSVVPSDLKHHTHRHVRVHRRQPSNVERVPRPAGHIELSADGFGMIGQEEGSKTHPASVA